MPDSGGRDERTNPGRDPVGTRAERTNPGRDPEKPDSSPPVGTRAKRERERTNPGAKPDSSPPVGTRANRTRPSLPALTGAIATSTEDTSRRERERTTSMRMPRLSTPVPPELRPRLRTRIVLAMAVAALVPVAIVALIATRVILSSLEGGLREDANRQLTTGLNLVLRSVERLGDEAVQLSEDNDLAKAVDQASHPATPASAGAPALVPPEGPSSAGLETWFAHEAVYVPSSRLQLVDATGVVVFDRVVGGATARFKGIEISSAEARALAKDPWNREVALVPAASNTGIVLRAMSPIVDSGLALHGVLVLSVPLDGDFADGVKGALSADVMLGGRTGALAVTFRSPLGTRADPVALDDDTRTRALAGGRVIENLDTASGRYEVAITALHDRAEQAVGLVGVAVDRSPLASTQSLALRSLVIGGAAALAFALVLALLFSRRLGRPIGRLHRGAIAVSRGDLDHRIEVVGDDELTDLAAAFNQMTHTLKENQARLAARMREIVALHDAGRAVSSVIELDGVSRKIVDAVARTFDVQLAAVWISEGGASPGVRASAARVRRAGLTTALAADDSLAAAEALRDVAEHVRVTRVPLRLDDASLHIEYGPAASSAGNIGPLLALPLDRKVRVVGVLAVARAAGAREFSEADLNLLTTFADQAGAAVENALLYREVRGASEELEKKVRLRTTELTAINTELGRALADLRETQAQLVLSERMAGLGLLVAGVAHEINSPTAAIRGSIEGLAAALERVARRSAEVAAAAPSPAIGAAITAIINSLAPPLAQRPLVTGLAARKAAKQLVAELGDLGGIESELADLGVSVAEARGILDALGVARAKLARPVVETLVDHVFLHRTASTVSHAVSQIQRIVGSLKTYSHLDQQATRTEADLHEGIETTLVLLHHALRDIVVERDFGELPRVPVYVDELNQVWTNLISNAQQALQGKGTIAIETRLEGDAAVVRVIDNGPGVPAEALPRIFEPFFTTKPKGEGTGLGLGICRQIVEKHGGKMRCDSVPGRTVFEVRLPVVVGRGAGQ